MSKLKLVLLLVVVYGAGLLTPFLLDSQGFSLTEYPMTLAGHRMRIEKFHEMGMDPQNYSFDSQLNCSFWKPPDRLELHLAVLEAAGEVEHIDLVFPNVPVTSAINRLWMDFCSEHPGIMHASGNPSRTSLEPAGEQPLHLNLWVKTSAIPEVSDLIHILEAASDK
ncbi:hypothetical protein [Planctomicrobium sp. SH664]|uniref:hypothetical protein n=1 Tax=Planctomicrobium sp. SH664 TaxID=3448125 RepID=UPI003F5C5DE5